MREIDSVSEVVAKRLCVGCGACTAIEPGTRLADFEREGIRPLGDDVGDGKALLVCPVVVPQKTSDREARTMKWGPILEIWEGHATDEAIRFRGSSGGALTAVSAYCIEQGGMHGVLHVAQDAEDPIRNRTRLSRSREDLLEAVGSRYSPGSVCNGLGLMAESPSPCVVVGRPAEIAAVAAAEKVMPGLSGKIGVTLSFFCAESPSTAGTKALLAKMGVAAKAVADLKYRGRGWPGHFAPTVVGASKPVAKMTYQESWAFLQAFRPWSTHIWPDGTGEAADIACGDPWYEQPDGKNPGSSMIVVRTERGRRILRSAVQAGYLELKPSELWKLEKSQENLLKKKGAVWGRIMAMRLFGLPTPRHDMRALFHCWKKLSLREKLQSTVGTVQRIVRRKLYLPLELNPSTATPVKRAFDCGADSGTGEQGKVA